MIKNEKLKAAILKSGYRRDFIAEKVGLTEGSFKGVCAGTTRISVGKAIEIAKFLKVPLHEIWTDLPKK